MKYLKLIQFLYKPSSLLVLIIGFSSPVYGENETSTLLPSDGDSFTTIQDAIDPVLDGDKIVVPSGTYVENFERLTPEEIISTFSLRMVEIDSKGPVALGYPKFDEIEVSLPKFKISGETVTFGIWSKVRQAAERKLGWELAEGLQGSGHDDTNENHPVTKIGFLDVTLWCNPVCQWHRLCAGEPCHLQFVHRSGKQDLR